MSPASSPALLPVALFLLGVAAGPSLAWLPVALPVGLVSAAIAGRGRAGVGLAALAAGLLLGALTAAEAPSDEPDRVAEAGGRLCGFWRERPAFATRSARFCPEWLRQGSALLTRAPRLWLELPLDVAPPPLGARVRVRGTLARFPGLANEAEVRPGPWRLRVKSGRHLRVVAAPRLLERLAQAVRTRVLAAIASAGEPPRPGVALTRAFVLGDESGLDESRARALRRTGLAHLLAVSGFNVTLLAGLAAVALSASGSRPARLLAPALAIVLYLAAVGPEPSLLRAAWMAGAALAAIALRRPGSALQALALTAGLLVALDPAALRDAGFQLSFGATLALVVTAERWARALKPLPAPLAIALATSFAAQAGTLPWSVEAFAELVPAAPLWNLLAVPWAALWMVIGLGWTLVALASPPLARATAPALDLGAAPFAWLERLPPSPWTSVWLPGGWTAGLLVALMIALAFELRRGRGAALLALAALAVAPARATATEAEVVFVDVGQGDAAIVRGGGATLLVDGGGQVGRDLGAVALRPLLARRGVRRVDVALLSHADLDHCLGLVDLTAHVPIDEIWLPAGAEGIYCAARLAARAARGVRALTAGDRLVLGALRVVVLHPPGSGPGSNRDSLVARVDLAGRRLLFTGDLPASEERRLARERPAELRADLLKVSHHGSAGSSAPEFLALVRPRWAVVSAGARNPFGHPADSALRRLAAAGARIARTDRDGEVIVRWREGAPWRLELPGSPRRVATGR